MTWFNCSIGNSSNNETCDADFAGMSAYTGKKPTNCTTANTQFDNVKLNSTEAKAWQTCIMDGCGCSAATIAKFGLVMFFGLLGYLFK